ncbi:hypothetical protein [Streptomyces sp. NRRL S-1813]
MGQLAARTGLPVKTVRYYSELLRHRPAARR